MKRAASEGAGGGMTTKAEGDAAASADGAVAANATGNGAATGAARSRKPDSPRVAKRRTREARTISQMIALYCAGHHASSKRTEVAHCGERVCPACADLDAYALLRTQRCRSMEAKTSCEKCGNHCYRAAERERIRAVMRYAGPRMLTRHPIAAMRHLLGK